MRRTELIPQKSPASALVTGKLFYHFSLSRKNTNAPSQYREHQIAFFESHFTELMSGAPSGQSGPVNTLRFAINKQTKWSTVWEADVWYNFAYEIVCPISVSFSSPDPHMCLKDETNRNIGLLRKHCRSLAIHWIFSIVLGCPCQQRPCFFQWCRLARRCS